MSKSITRMNNNVIMNWPGIKVVRQLSVSQLIKEHMGYLQRIHTDIGNLDEIPGFADLVSDWERGLEKLRKCRVLIMLGVGMQPQNVQNHIDCLGDSGIRAVTFEWPEFVGEMASFKAQSWWLEQQEITKDKQLVLVGHSLGHLVGLQFVHDNSKKIAAFLGSSGPCRSHDDVFPAELVELLKKIEQMSGEDGMQTWVQRADQLLSKFRIKIADFPARTKGGLGAMARIYLAHILPSTPDYWEKLYRELPDNLPAHYRYGLHDRTVIRGVGMGAVFQAHNAEIVFDPNADHMMYSPQNTLKVLGHLLARS